jgi:16S rRNA (cytidine1402-2'-O)-methyltransferase
MSLFLVATPIGNPKDISLRAIELLKEADVIVGEERKILMPFLKSHGCHEKMVEWLNEHSKERDVDFLVDLCKTKKVALVSDCGTPGFCDPGSLLVKRCRSLGIEVKSLPGASSLMTLISLSGERLDRFQFWGFLSTDKEPRQKSLNLLKTIREPVILMDTPYRLSRLMDELKAVIPSRQCLLGLELTKPEEFTISNSIAKTADLVRDKKLEFVLLIYP